MKSSMNPDVGFVFDTNVLLSAFLFRGSVPRQVFDVAIQTGRLVYSDETLEELWDVLVRPKFDRFLPLSDRVKLLEGFETISQHVVIQSGIELCRDPKDNKFLNLTVSANARCIITGDKDLLELVEIAAIPIITPAQFLEKNQPV